jgi:hypothetical protein
MIKFEGERPVINFQPDGKYLSQNISIIVEDRKSGVREVTVEALQEGKTIKLFSQGFPKKTNRVEKIITVRPLPEGLKEPSIPFPIHPPCYLQKISLEIAEGLHLIQL